eukprot:scaffold14367_cov250-Ochromonas_danica.AAC.35
MGLKKAWRNGAMRRGWNGITISRDTIHIDGVKLGLTLLSSLKDMLLVVNMVRAGKQSEDNNVVVTYQNPLDNVGDLAHHFFTRCLKAKVVSYVVTKKTVFKWQEGFWKIMKKVFDEYYKQQYIDSGIIPDGKLQHLISDAATMQIIRWTKGGFGMAAHNYDGDMLTDEIAQAYRSPGFITSNLIGKREDGVMIKEFEASHGTVADLWHAHLRGEETSMNPLGLTFGAMNHSAGLRKKKCWQSQESSKAIQMFFARLYTTPSAMERALAIWPVLRDLALKSSLTRSHGVLADTWPHCTMRIIR